MPVVVQKSLEQLSQPGGRAQPGGGRLHRGALEIPLGIRVQGHLVQQLVQLLQHQGALHIAGAGQQAHGLGLLGDGAVVGPARDHILDDGAQEARQRGGLDMHGHGVFKKPGFRGNFLPRGGAAVLFFQLELLQLATEALHHPRGRQAIAQQFSGIHQPAPPGQRGQCPELGHHAPAEGLRRLLGAGPQHTRRHDHIAREVEEQVAVGRGGDLPVAVYGLACPHGHLHVLQPVVYAPPGE